jgi:hypothetical protein
MTETDVEVVISARLLEVLHDEAVRLQAASNVVLAGWGRHLLVEDWRSLELLAERDRP